MHLWSYQHSAISGQLLNNQDSSINNQVNQKIRLEKGIHSSRPFVRKREIWIPA
jgi:hypothetical protein